LTGRSSVAAGGWHDSTHGGSAATGGSSDLTGRLGVVIRRSGDAGSCGSAACASQRDLRRFGSVLGSHGKVGGGERAGCPVLGGV